MISSVNAREIFTYEPETRGQKGTAAYGDRIRAEGGKEDARGSAGVPGTPS